jgi:MFS family permease
VSDNPLARPGHILPIIVAAQFSGTALWFSGNAILPALQSAWGLAPESIGSVTTAVQAGFIMGTLVFAVLAISDRFSPRLIFLACALLGAAANAAILLPGADLWRLLAMRFATGFFIAGIYPIGMKIASGWYQRDLGMALGFLVGALVLGTAFPHLVRGVGQSLPWQSVMLATSTCAVAGGLLMAALVPDGPYLKPGRPFAATALAEIFRSRDFRASSFGYFGHMWELYAFWAFVPHLLAVKLGLAGTESASVALLAFLVIAVGGIGCTVGGLFSLRHGSARVATIQLVASGMCCLVSPFMFLAPAPVFIAFLVFWGVVVVGDSPQFSALNARYAPGHLVGSALTIANCIGFAISIASIQLLAAAIGDIDPAYLFLLLLPGPVFGVLSMRPLLAGAAAQVQTG